MNARTASHVFVNVVAVVSTVSKTRRLKDAKLKRFPQTIHKFDVRSTFFPALPKIYEIYPFKPGRLANFFTSLPSNKPWFLYRIHAAMIMLQLQCCSKFRLKPNKNYIRK